MFVFNTAFDGEQKTGTRFQPETPNPSQPKKWDVPPLMWTMSFEKPD